MLTLNVDAIINILRIYGKSKKEVGDFPTVCKSRPIPTNKLTFKSTNRKAYVSFYTYEMFVLNVPICC